MSKIKFFQELINSLFEKPIKNKSFNFFSDKKKNTTSKDHIENVAYAKGEVSALGYAELLMQHCEELNDKEGAWLDWKRAAQLGDKEAESWIQETSFSFSGQDWRIDGVDLYNAINSSELKG